MFAPLQAALRDLGLESSDVDDIVQIVQDRLDRAANKRKGFGQVRVPLPAMLPAKLGPSSSSSAAAAPATLASATSSSDETLKYLIADEQNYLKKLHIIVHSYLRPTKEDQARLFKSKDGGVVIARLFCNIDEIYANHVELAAELAEAGQRGAVGQIGPIFCRFIPKLHHYAVYIANFTKAVEFFQDADAAEKYKSFFAFLDSVEQSDEQAEAMGLQMLLACPLNRMPQYEFLLGLFLQSMSKTDVHYKSLLEAMALLSDLQSVITTALLNAERLFPIQAAAAKIAGYPGIKLEEGQRVFLKEGPLLALPSDGKDKGKERPVYAFLFSDKMVVCESTLTASLGLSVFSSRSRSDTAPAQYKFKEEIQLQHTTVDATLPPLPGGKLPFAVSSWDGTNQTPYRFAVAAEQERKDWVQAFASVSSSLDKTKLFGVELEKIVEREQQAVHAAAAHLVPKFVASTCSALNAAALDTSGLYRVSGAAKQIHLLRDQVDRDQPVAFADIDHHVLSGLLKLYFRELPKALLSPDESFFDRYLAALAAPDTIAALRALVHSLPPVYYATLHTLLDHLVKLASHADTNKMTPSNIAIVFAPNLLRPPVSGASDQESQVRCFGDICLIVEQMIVHFSDIFTNSTISSVSTSSSATAASSSSSSSSSSSVSVGESTTTTAQSSSDAVSNGQTAAAPKPGTSSLPPPAVPSRTPRVHTGGAAAAGPIELPLVREHRSTTEPPRPNVHIVGRGAPSFRQAASVAASPASPVRPSAAAASPPPAASPPTTHSGSGIAANPFMIRGRGRGRGASSTT